MVWGFSSLVSSTWEMVFNKQPEISCAFTSISIPAIRFRGFDWYCHDGLDSVEFRGYCYCRRSGFGRAFESSSGYWYCHGANIGTTVTSFMIGFKLGDYALPVIFLGAALLFFTSNKKLNNLGRILFGVGGFSLPLTLWEMR